MNDKEIEELGKVLDEAEKQGLTDKEIASEKEKPLELSPILYYLKTWQISRDLHKK